MSRLADRSISTTQVDVENPATTIVDEDDLAWRVECEGGCGRRIHVAKRDYIPVDYADPNGPLTCTEYNRPGARRCALCGPFTK